MRSRIGSNEQGLGTSNSAGERLISVLVSTKYVERGTYSESVRTFMLEALTHQSELLVLVPGLLGHNC